MSSQFGKRPAKTSNEEVLKSFSVKLLDFFEAVMLPLHPASAGGGEDSRRRKKRWLLVLTRKERSSDLCPPFRCETAGCRERPEKNLGLELAKWRPSLL
ncbi:hypothetical protein, partial [Hymenobacter edaphi]|uniref:hypothetical protein n=1 Tax=Hymenobacter edaphi TaxID=2211146 RepID=UPI001A9FFAFD